MAAILISAACGGSEGRDWNHFDVWPPTLPRSHFFSPAAFLTSAATLRTSVSLTET